MSKRCFFRQTLSSLDIEKAYYHVSIAQGFRKYFCFRLNDRGFQFVAMPFGLAVAPFIFTRLIVPILNLAHSENIRVVSYIDDFFVAAPRHLIASHLGRVESLLVEAGFSISEKSNRSPCRVLKFLGICFHTPSLVSSIPMEKQDEIKEGALSLLQSSSVSRRLLEGFIGLVNYFSNHTFILRSLMWKIIRLTNSQSQAVTRDRRFQLSLALRSALQQVVALNMARPVPFATPGRWESLTVDASDSGWGAYWNQEKVFGQWSRRWAALSINIRELQAIFLALDHWKTSLAGSAVLVFTDNAAAAAIVRRKGSVKSLRLNEVQERIEVLSLSLNLI